ncbi:hypothetical protein FOCC_FOCC014542 [Frankliniella occidentalis]|nr:hypothetical protein FOCC_FOCC014542 [Frankliniella occidentalis]
MPANIYRVAVFTPASQHSCEAKQQQAAASSNTLSPNQPSPAINMKLVLALFLVAMCFAAALAQYHHGGHHGGYNHGGGHHGGHGGYNNHHGGYNNHHGGHHGGGHHGGGHHGHGYHG